MQDEKCVESCIWINDGYH